MIFVALIFFHKITLISSQGHFEDRYLWVVRNTLINQRSIDQMIKFATLNRFNHILVQVRGRGDAFYQSDLVPKTHLIKDINFDPLAYLIPKAKQNGIKVHAWVNTYLLWSSKTKPVQKEHLLFKKPEWLDQANNLPLDVNKEMEKFNFQNNMNEGFYLAPNHPRVNSYLISVFKELIANYDLDGLHLDYVRFHDSEFGKNPYAIAFYKQSNRLSISTSEIINSNKWNDHRRKAVTDLVRETKSLIELVKPEMILTAAVKPNLYQARERFHQEWDVWLAAGYLDKAIVMNYAKDLKGFAANIDIMYDNLPSKYRKKIVMGIATYNQPARQVVDKVQYTRVTRFNGISFFSYNVMAKNSTYFRPIKKILYPRR